MSKPSDMLPKKETKVSFTLNNPGSKGWEVPESPKIRPKWSDIIEEELKEDIVKQKNQKNTENNNLYIPPGKKEQTKMKMINEIEKERVEKMKKEWKKIHNTENRTIQFKDESDEDYIHRLSEYLNSEEPSEDHEIMIKIIDEHYQRSGPKLFKKTQVVRKNTYHERVLKQALRDCILSQGLDRKDLEDTNKKRSFYWEEKEYKLSPDIEIHNGHKIGLEHDPYYIEEFYGIDNATLESKYNKYELLSKLGMGIYIFAPFCKLGPLEREVEQFMNWRFVQEEIRLTGTVVKTYTWNTKHKMGSKKKVTYHNAPYANFKDKEVEVNENDKDLWTAIKRHEKIHREYYNKILGFEDPEEKEKKIKDILKSNQNPGGIESHKNRDFSVMNVGTPVSFPHNLTRWTVVRAKLDFCEDDTTEIARFAASPEYREALDKLHYLRSAYRWKLQQHKVWSKENKTKFSEYQKELKEEMKKELKIPSQKWDPTYEGTFRYPKSGNFFKNNGVREIEELMRSRNCSYAAAVKYRAANRQEKKKEPRHTTDNVPKSLFHMQEQRIDTTYRENYKNYETITKDSVILEQVERSAQKEARPMIDWIEESLIGYQVKYDSECAQAIDYHWNQGKTGGDLNLTLIDKDILVSDGFKSIKGEFTKPYCIIGCRLFKTAEEERLFLQMNDLRLVWKLSKENTDDYDISMTQFPQYKNYLHDKIGDYHSAIAFVTNWRRAQPSQVGRIRYAVPFVINLLSRAFLIWKEPAKMKRQIIAEYLTYRISNFELAQFLDSCLKAGQNLLGDDSKVEKALKEMFEIPQKHKMGNYWKSEYKKDFLEILSLRKDPEHLFKNPNISYRGGTLYNIKSLLELLNRVKLGDKQVTSTHHRNIVNWKGIKSHELKRMASEAAGIAGGQCTIRTLLNELRTEDGGDFKIFFSNSLTYHAMRRHLNRLQADGIDLDKTFRQHGEKISSRNIWEFGNNKASMDHKFKKCKLVVAIARLMEDPEYEDLASINDVLNEYNKRIGSSSYDKTPWQLYWYWANKEQIGSHREFWIENVIGRLFTYYQDNFFRECAAVDSKNQILDSRKDADIITKFTRLKNEAKQRNVKILEMYNDTLPTAKQALITTDMTVDQKIAAVLAVGVPVDVIDTLWKVAQISEDESKWAPAAENEEYFGVHKALYDAQCITLDQYHSLQDGVLFRRDKRVVVVDSVNTCPDRDNIIKTTGISTKMKTYSLGMSRKGNRPWTDEQIEKYSEEKLNKIYDVLDDSFVMKITWGNGMRQISSSVRHVAIQDWLEYWLGYGKDDIQTAHHSDDKWTALLYQTREDLRKYQRLSYITKRMVGIKMNPKKTFMSDFYGEYLSFYLLNGKIYYPLTKKILSRVPDHSYRSYEYDFIASHMSVISLIENGALPINLWLYRMSVNCGLHKKWGFQRDAITPYGGKSRSNAYMLAAGGSCSLLMDCLNSDHWFEVVKGYELFKRRNLSDNIMIQMGELNYFQTHIAVSRSFFGQMDRLHEIKKKLRIDPDDIDAAKYFVEEDPTLLFRNAETAEEGLIKFYLKMDKPDVIFGMDTYTAKFARSRYMIYRDSGSYSMISQEFLTYKEIIQIMNMAQSEISEDDKRKMIQMMCNASPRFYRSAGLRQMSGTVRNKITQYAKMFTYYFSRMNAQLITQKDKEKVIMDVLRARFEINYFEKTNQVVNDNNNEEEVKKQKQERMWEEFSLKMTELLEEYKRKKANYEIIAHIIRTEETKVAFRGTNLDLYRFLDALILVDNTTIRYAIFPKTSIIKFQMQRKKEGEIDFIDFLEVFLEAMCDKGSTSKGGHRTKYYSPFDEKTYLVSKEGQLRQEEDALKMATYMHFNGLPSKLVNLKYIRELVEMSRDKLLTTCLGAYVFLQDDKPLRQYFKKSMIWYDGVQWNDVKTMGYVYTYPNSNGACGIVKETERGRFFVACSPHISIQGKERILEQLNRLSFKNTPHRFAILENPEEYAETFRQLKTGEFVFGKIGWPIQVRYFTNVSLFGAFDSEVMTVEKDFVAFGVTKKRKYHLGKWWDDFENFQQEVGFLDGFKVKQKKLVVDFCPREYFKTLRNIIRSEYVITVKRIAPGENQVMMADIRDIMRGVKLPGAHPEWQVTIEESKLMDDPRILDNLHEQEKNNLSKQARQQIMSIIMQDLNVAPEIRNRLLKNIEEPKLIKVEKPSRNLDEFGIDDIFKARPVDPRDFGFDENNNNQEEWDPKKADFLEADIEEGEDLEALSDMDDPYEI